MAADSERNYTGTNVVVISLIALLVLVAGYFLIAQGSDVADDGVTGTQRGAAVR